MPGLNQLKNFVDNVVALGNEIAVRRSHGDVIETVTFPQGISEASDVEDFAYGIPGQNEAVQPAEDAEAEALLKEMAQGGGAELAPLSGEGAGEAEAAEALEDVPELGGSAAGEAMDLGELPEIGGDAAVESFDSAEAAGGAGFEMPEFDADSSAGGAASAPDDFAMPEFDAGTDAGASSLDAELPDFGGETGAGATASDDVSLPDFGEDSSAGGAASALDNFDMPEFDAGTDAGAASLGGDALPDFGDDAGAGTTALDDISLPDFGVDSAEPAATDAGAAPSGGASLDMPDFGAESAASADSSGGGMGMDLDLPDFDNMGDAPAAGGGSSAEEAALDLPDFGSEGASADVPAEASLDIGGDAGDLGIDLSAIADAGGEADADVADAPAEEAAAADDGEIDFSISGFTDVPDVSENAKKPKKGDKGESAAKPAKFGKAAKNEDVSPEDSNEITEYEYKKFIENLNYYPLNLRMEIENMLLGTEEQFTDEVCLKVVRMVIKKTPVLKLARYMGELLDKHIEVPRDYDKRTAAEYEAYKQTPEYQLKNRIIPFALMCTVVAIFAVSLFILGKTFVYEPIRAEILYKAGYTLLENDQFAQSEERFLEATNFKKKQAWFFKYARGYREKKQFGHARQMYQWILQCFPKNKRGGLEYAEMELYDLNNYEEAERIVRREVLDKFINDPDGMMLLGDIYLEWASDKAPEKFELALQQYQTVIDMYGQKDSYLAHLLRYYIRTDNLREVIPLKNHFYPDKKTGPKKIKALSANDIYELSSYLLDKLYVYLAPTEEYLRIYIEDVRALLEQTILADPAMPEAYYNYGRYFIYTANAATAQTWLEKALEVFDAAKSRTRDRILKNVDTYRLLGELYVNQQEYLKAEELFTKGVALFEAEKVPSALKAGKEVGVLYSDLADLDYFLSGDTDHALRNYEHSVEYGNDNASIRYRIGFIQYGKQDYIPALTSFIKAAEDKGNDLHLLLSLGNVLALRDDNFAAQGYYRRFMDEFERQRSLFGVMVPQVLPEHQDLVECYMHAANNFGVTLGNLAFRTGDSNLNAQGMVYLSESMRAWDALTRNQETLVRLGGSNLAAQNMKYLSHPVSEYEPALYFDIPRTLQDEEILTQQLSKKNR